MCNEKYAADVIRIMPHSFIYDHIILCIAGIYFCYSIDNHAHCGILKITNNIFGGRDVITIRRETKKSFFSSRGGNTQYLPRKSQSPWFSGRRFFRSSRYSPSQIRNASTRPSGKCNCDGDGQGIWIFPQCLLSFQFKIRRSWNKRTDSRKTRSPRSSQGRRRNTEFSQKQHRRGETCPGTQACNAGATGVWSRYPSEDNRTCTEWKKNTAVKANATATSDRVFPIDSVFICQRYEKLRRAALGEAIHVEDRSGLVLFLRHGMLHWIRGISKTDFFIKGQSAHRRYPADVAVSQQNINHSKEIVKIFASMTFHTRDEKGGAYE